MEISATGNSNLISRPLATTSGDRKSKSANVGASFISKESSEVKLESNLMPPSNPTAKIVPEKNTMQTNENKESIQFSITV
tara:strand:+ start:17338 stop:17580 length:243 start_codon:yes stop_codon:yes gene_type:complete